MHKYYDPKFFDVMDVDDLKAAYAPKEDAGVLLGRGDADALDLCREASESCRCDNHGAFHCRWF